MRYPPHIDPRAYQYFTQGYVGRGHGDVLDHKCAEDREGGTACERCVYGGVARSSRSTRFVTMSPLASTATVAISWSRHFCVYCGNIALPLQDPDTYATIGYTCGCAGACDEREFVARRAEMRERHCREATEMQKTAPIASKEVLASIWRQQSEQVLKEIAEGCVPQAFEGIGVIIGSCEDS